MKPLKIGDFQGQQVSSPEGKPPFSCGFPMNFPIFLCFSYGFPVVFQPVGPYQVQPPVKAISTVGCAQAEVELPTTSGRLVFRAPNSEHRLLW